MVSIGGLTRSILVNLKGTLRKFTGKNGADGSSASRWLISGWISTPQRWTMESGQDIPSIMLLQRVGMGQVNDGIGELLQELIPDEEILSNQSPITSYRDWWPA